MSEFPKRNAPILSSTETEVSARNAIISAPVALLLTNWFPRRTPVGLVLVPWSNLPLWAIRRASLGELDAALTLKTKAWAFELSVASPWMSVPLLIGSFSHPER